MSIIFQENGVGEEMKQSISKILKKCLQEKKMMFLFS